MLTDSTIPAVMTPMITTTTSTSMRVNPRGARRAPGARLRREATLVGDVPVADVGIDAITARSAIGSEAVQVVLLAVRAGEDILIVIAPGVLADALQVAAGAPVLDRRIGRLCGECQQALLGGRVFRVVEPEHGERGLETLDVLFRLGDARLIHTAHDLRHDDRRQQTDDDHHHHDLDEGEAAGAAHAVRSGSTGSREAISLAGGRSANLKCVAHELHVPAGLAIWPKNGSG